MRAEWFKRLRTARRVAVLTGAGVSAESGIPTFRGVGGLWEKYSVTDLATPEAFERDPDLVWRFYNERRIQMAGCQPNSAHEAIAELERRFPEFLLITQNIDGLHERAGSRLVCHMHGSIWHVHPPGDRSDIRENRETPLSEIPLRDHDGSLLRPAVVWFGEMLPEAEISRAAQFLETVPDILIVAGTSSEITWVQAMALKVKRDGGFLWEINLEETGLSVYADASTRKPASEAFQEILDSLD